MFHGESIPCTSSSLERSPLLHGESLPGRSESSRCFTASLFLAGRLVSSALLFFTANLVLAGRSRLGVSRRVSSLLVGFI